MRIVAGWAYPDHNNDHHNNDHHNNDHYDGCANDHDLSGARQPR